MTERPDRVLKKTSTVTRLMLPRYMRQLLNESPGNIVRLDVHVLAAAEGIDLDQDKSAEALLLWILRYAVESQSVPGWRLERDPLVASFRVRATRQQLETTPYEARR